jgi:hypothetical protein
VSVLLLLFRVAVAALLLVTTTTRAEPAAAALPSADRLHQLAHDIQWLRLLHAARDGRRSEVLSPEFFLSADGPRDPEAELRATLLAYDLPFGSDTNTHARCRFPARYLWLSQQLELPGYRAQDPRCKRLAEWARLDQLRSVSLLLVSGYFGNPASSFGHALLRFNTEEGRASEGLTDLGVNFGALVPEGESTPVYVFKGLFGGYQAGFSDKPYYSHDLIYTRTEFRDMWDHELVLNDHERLLLVYHLWEIVGKKFTYYFMKENCAYRIAEALVLARNEELLAHSSVWFAPVEVFHRLRDAEQRHGRPWIASVRFVPSAERVLRHEFDALTPEEAEVANAVIAQSPDGMSALQQLAAPPRAKVLDALLSYYDYRIAGEEPKVSDALKQAKEAMLRARLPLPPRTGAEPAVAALPSPADGNAPLLVGLGIGHDEQRGSYARLRWSPFSYELSGFNGLRDGELVVLDTTLDIDGHGRGRLDGVDVIRVRKLSANRLRIAGESWLSWQVRLGAQRELGAGPLRLQATLGGGIARSIGSAATAWVMVDGSALSRPSALGIEPHAGMVMRLDRWKLWTQVGSRYDSASRHWLARQHLEASYLVARDHTLRLELTHERTLRGVLSWLQYW